MQYDVTRATNRDDIDEGAGPVILALHGLFSAPRDWSGLVGHFCRDCRVVVPVLPVHDLPRDDATVTAILRYLERFIEDRGLAAVNLVGNSLGGQIALMYAGTHPANVATLALTGSSGLRETSMTGRLLRNGTAPRRDDYALIRSLAETVVYDPAVATRERIDEVYTIVNDDARLATTVAVVKSGMRMKMSDVLRGLDVPTCLIWGKDDAITPTDVAEDFHARLANSDLFWIAKCGHAAMVEHPDAFNGLLSAWYEKRGVLGSPGDHPAHAARTTPGTPDDTEIDGTPGSGTVRWRS